MLGLELIDREKHHSGMFGLVLIGLIVIVAPLSCAFGVDSRVDDVTRRRHFNG